MSALPALIPPPSTTRQPPIKGVSASSQRITRYFSAILLFCTLATHSAHAQTVIPLNHISSPQAFPVHRPARIPARPVSRPQFSRIIPAASQPAPPSPPAPLSTPFPLQFPLQPGQGTSISPRPPTQPASPFPMDAPTTRLCREATAQVERALRLPEDFLSAISRVETGRMGKDGTLTPWPWSLNVAGTGYFYPTREEAITAAKAFLQQGIRSIDVGCLQINLLYHPNAFPSLEAAFDPYSNARYGGIFLQKLHEQTGSWPHAAAAYHSQNSNKGMAYLQRVLQQWATPQLPRTQPDHSLTPNALPVGTTTRIPPITASVTSPAATEPSAKPPQNTSNGLRATTGPAILPSPPVTDPTPPIAENTTPHPYDHRQFRPFRGLFRPAMPPPPHQRMKSQNGRNLASYRVMPIHPDHTMPYASAY